MSCGWQCRGEASPWPWAPWGRGLRLLFSLPHPWPEQLLLTPQVSVQTSPPKSPRTPAPTLMLSLLSPDGCQTQGGQDEQQAGGEGASFLERETFGALSRPPS